jgi:hypothetical protein
MNVDARFRDSQSERQPGNNDLALRFDELHAKYMELLKRLQAAPQSVPPGEGDDYSLPRSSALARVIMRRVKRYVTGPRLRDEIVGQFARGRGAANLLLPWTVPGLQARGSAIVDAAVSNDGPVSRFPVGHYYSPMYDTRELANQRETLWPSTPPQTIGLDWRDTDQLRMCREVFAQQQHLHFVDNPTDDPYEYYTHNDFYPALDAWVLEGILQHFRPQQMIEVGCGFSTLVSARVNREQLDGEMHLTCIEPYPRQFLNGVPGVSALRVERVQDTPLGVFAELRANDILFIDTSHTVKTGGDVNWIYHEIIPRLAPGVVIHLHDIFLPREYPEPWVMEGWGWNEAYLVRSFLSFNAAFEILWGTQYMLEQHKQDVFAAFPDVARYADRGGASFWIRRNT